jgi:gas vesicle protein
MEYKLLNVRNVRTYIKKEQVSNSKFPGRRKFIRTVGLGVLFWNPLFEMSKYLSAKPFEILFSNKVFSVLRNGKVAWTISEKLFEKGYTLKLITGKDRYQITGHGLQVRNTNMVFSVLAEIFRDKSDWKMNLKLPELSIDKDVDFLDWIDNNTDVSSDISTNSNLVDLNFSDHIELKGNGKICVNSNWDISLDGPDIINVQLNNTNYLTDLLVIKPSEKIPAEFLNSVPSVPTIVTAPGFKGWPDFVSDFSFDDGNHLSAVNDNPDLNFLIGGHKSGSNYKAVWVDEIDGNLLFEPKGKSNEIFAFRRYFYFSEYNNDSPPEFYLGAEFHPDGQWIANNIGSFKLENDKFYPVFEAFGVANEPTNHIFEPRLKAFSPLIAGAVTLHSYFENPAPLQVKLQQDKKVLNKRPVTPQKVIQPAQTQPIQTKPVQKQPIQTQPIQAQPIQAQPIQTQPTQTQPSQTTPQDTNKQGKSRMIQRPEKSKKVTPQLSFEPDKTVFVPKIPIKITLMRPEDLILLEYEFFNFKFTNNGAVSYLELDNPEINGTMIVYFPSQHTLEEAWFEQSKIPSADTIEQMPANTISLPARQVRAHKSRLVYDLKAGHKGFPFSVEELLDWSRFELNVHPRAWIDLDILSKYRKFRHGNLQKMPQTRKRSIVPYKKSESVEYGIKLSQNNKYRQVATAENQTVIIQNSLSPEKFSALTSKVTEILGTFQALKPAEIPATSTSIEAPALMYISPNQVNDFSHKIKLDLKPVKFQGKNLKSPGDTFLTIDQSSNTENKIAELWHTKLGVKFKDGQTSNLALEDLKTIRVLWSREFGSIPTEKNQPFMASLDSLDRYKLVRQTSDYSIPGYSPSPVPVKKLFLTSLGAYIDWHVLFDISPIPKDQNLNILEWEHIATLGRDHYVKVVEEGYLFPLGHRAAVVKITERKFHQNTRAALNLQRMYIVVLEKEVTYDPRDPSNKFIEFPFRKVTIETSYTPDIDNPYVSPSTIIIPGSFCFYIYVDGADFKFDILATDKEGIDHRIRMPLLFVDSKSATDSFNSKIVTVVNSYDANDQFSIVPLSGQKVSFSGSLVEGDTAFETENIKFSAKDYQAGGANDIKFHPVMKNAQVYLEQVEALTGARKPATISLIDDNNDGNVFASVENANVDFSGSSDKTGGFVTPNMSISALSKLQGPVGGEIENAKKLIFKADDFFKDLEGFQLPDPKIFGVIKLSDLISDLGLDSSGTFDTLKEANSTMITEIKKIREKIDSIKNDILDIENEIRNYEKEVQNTINNTHSGPSEDISEQTDAVKDALNKELSELKAEIPKLVKELLDELEKNIPKVPNFKVFTTEKALHVEYKWKPDFKSENIDALEKIGFPDVLYVNVDDPQDALSISTYIEKPFDLTTPAVFTGEASFKNFGIEIKDLLAISFNLIEFKTGSSQKTDIKVDLKTPDPILFKGPLSFVNNLQSIIPSTGFSGDGPYIDLKPTGITAGFSISVPSLQVGICMLSNISLGANVTLPFTGAPLTIGFNFCNRENPFALIISCFGGGGYFMMVTRLDGIQSIDAAFEFGAALSLDVGVASGSVSAMGGIYYKLEIVDDIPTTTLSGYLRINGNLSVIGLINISMEFYLEFQAIIEHGKVEKLTGSATVKVKIEILFFSTSVSVTVRRELKAADADPTFKEMIDEDDWNEYCLAFAG